MAKPTVTRASALPDLVAAILDSPEFEQIISEIEDARLTGRKGYGTRALFGAYLIKHLDVRITWRRTARAIADSESLTAACGGAPSEWACYRFGRKLLDQPLLRAKLISALQAALRDLLPGYGMETIAVDATDLNAYANGQRTLWKDGPEREHYSDPDASWGHRSAISTRKGGGFYGYKPHAVVCAETELPIACIVEPANISETRMLDALLRQVTKRGFKPKRIVGDKAYAGEPQHEICRDHGVIPLFNLPRLPEGREYPDPIPTCPHGPMRWKGCETTRSRWRSKWVCPSGACETPTRWIEGTRMNPLIPRGSERWKKLYSKRQAIERVFGRLKHDYGLQPLRIRSLERVRLHTDMTLIAQLASRLAQERARAAALAA